MRGGLSGKMLQYLRKNVTIDMLLKLQSQLLPLGLEPQPAY